MKCPQCNHNQKYRDGMKCQKCGYLFVIDPKKYPGYSDARFLSMVKAINQDGSVYYTANQVYAFANLKPTSSIGCGAGLVVIAIICMAVGAFGVGIGILVMAVIVFVGKNEGWIKSSRSAISYSAFTVAWEKWKAKADLPTLITTETRLLLPAAAPESDVYDYGVEGVLVVDQDKYVDLLVRNGLHTEYKLLVVSQSGYPEHLRGVANRLLAERSDLPVYLLHNGTTAPSGMLKGFSLLGQPVFDMGLSKADFQNRAWFKPFSKHPELPVDVLSLARIRSLMGYCICLVQEMATAGTLPVSAAGAALLITPIALDALERPPYSSADGGGTADFG